MFVPDETDETPPNTSINADTVSELLAAAVAASKAHVKAANKAAK